MDEMCMKCVHLNDGKCELGDRCVSDEQYEYEQIGDNREYNKIEQWIVITTKGTIQRVDGDFWFVVRELAEIPFIEITHVQGFPDLRLIVDEEGLLKRLPINPIASALYGEVIVGNVVIGEERVYPEPDVYPMDEERAKTVENMCKMLKSYIN